MKNHHLRTMAATAATATLMFGLTACGGKSTYESSTELHEEFASAVTCPGAEFNDEELAEQGIVTSFACLSEPRTTEYIGIVVTDSKVEDVPEAREIVDDFTQDGPVLLGENWFVAVDYSPDDMPTAEAAKVLEDASKKVGGEVIGKVE